MKKNFKAKAFTVIALIVLFITAVMANIAINNKTNQTKDIASLTPEERRAMTYNLVTDEDGKIEGNDYVRFNAYFLRDLDNDGYAEKYDGTCRNINEKSMLYMDVNVLTEGKLINGKITINGQNFNLEMSMIADDILKKDYIADNIREIELKDMNAGTQKLIFGKITPPISNNINRYSCNTNTIVFTGTYVPLEGEPVEINKTIDLTVDWYGITTTSVSKLKHAGIFDDEGNYEVTFELNIKEESKQLILKENVVNIQIPELSDYDPVEVKCNNYETAWNYDENTKELTIIRESVVDGNGYVQKTLSKQNEYSITVKYPKEAYDAITSYDKLQFDFEAYYTGYNNTNQEFENPYKSNVVIDNIQYLINKEPQGSIFNFYVEYNDEAWYTRYNQKGYYLQDIINAYNNGTVAPNKKFTVRWEAVRGDQGVVPSMIMSETKENENYGDKWNSTIIEEYIENKGIYFRNASEFLGKDGSISVYNNDTNELIKVFTKDDWGTYTTSHPYTYDMGIKHIRVETSATNMNSNLYVYNIKELNTEKVMNDFTFEQFKMFTATYTYLTGICNIEGVGAKDRKVSDKADLVFDKSYAELSIAKKTAIINEKLENESLAINMMHDAKWKNGEFLIEVPAEIIYMEINDVTINATENVKLEAYELFQNDNGQYFIRIITKNENPENYIIGIHFNLTPSPTAATVNREFKLYAYNEMVQNYITSQPDIYDVNQNDNKTERVGYSTANIDFLAPTSLITMESVTDYDETSDSEITYAPNVALVNKEERQATINVHLTNNYENLISGIKILGKIPYENNAYIINEKNLHSEFTTQFTENGINIPESLSNRAVIYYSEKTNPTTDINNVENAWKSKEDVEDWSKIVSYIIYINDYVMTSKQKIQFSYDITLPQDVTLNMASYSTHAVYYDLNTENGKIKLSTEPTKVGVRIVKKYDMEITKFKLNSSIKIPGVKYAITYMEENEEGEVVEKQKIATTDSEGHIFVKGLLKNYEYTLKEIGVPETVELNENEMKFMVSENDELTINGDKKAAVFSNNKLSVELEDEIKANLVINKTKIGTNTNINNVYFNITDENGEAKVVKTVNGQAILNGLSLGKTYTLTEKKAPNNIEINPGVFKFKIIRDGNNLNVI
ncbi:MAG: hypothetical protein IKN09_00925, partial [Clostridia bacterium]|nr:hypothetical protein [Clostridia bacterium]